MKKQKPQRPKRKVILFLVEGWSEVTLLKPLMLALYDSIDPEIQVFFSIIEEDGVNCGGDITSKFGVYPGNIEKKIYEFFMKTFFSENKLYPKDITEIIHIVDLDGAYIPDDRILLQPNPKGEDRTYYDKDAILANKVENIIKRNQRKRENLDYLMKLSQMKVASKTIKYSVFFFSSNLDHFFCDNANMGNHDKVSYARNYVREFENDPQGFVANVKSIDGILTDMDYEQSWQFIKEGNNSIERHSNINILLDRIINEN